MTTKKPEKSWMENARAMGMPVPTITPEEKQAFHDEAGFGIWWAWGVDVVMLAVPPLVGALFFGLTARNFAALVWADAFVLWLFGLAYTAVDRARMMALPADPLPAERRFANLLVRWGWATAARVAEVEQQMSGSRPGLFRAVKSTVAFVALYSFLLVMIALMIGVTFDEEGPFEYLVVPLAVRESFTTRELWVFVVLAVLGKLPYFGRNLLGRASRENKGERLLALLGLSGPSNEYAGYCFVHIWGVLFAGIFVSNLQAGRITAVLFILVIVAFRAFVAYFSVNEHRLFGYLWEKASRES
jgi:hypothetical protein